MPTAVQLRKYVFLDRWPSCNRRYRMHYGMQCRCSLRCGSSGQSRLSSQRIWKYRRCAVRHAAMNGAPAAAGRPLACPPARGAGGMPRHKTNKLSSSSSSTKARPRPTCTARHGCWLRRCLPVPGAPSNPPLLLVLLIAVPSRADAASLVLILVNIVQATPAAARRSLCCRLLLRPCRLCCLHGLVRRLLQLPQLFWEAD